MSHQHVPTVGLALSARKAWVPLVLLLLAGATPVSAQTITRWTLRVYNVGARQPLSSPIDLIAGQGVTCNLDPASAMTTQNNPIRAAVWNDPAAAGRVCAWVDPGTGALPSTPLGGSYEASMTATNATGTSGESARVPFPHPGVPASPQSGVLLRK